MNKRTKKEEEADKRFILAFNQVENEIYETLESVAAVKSKEWGAVVEFKPCRFLYCKQNNLCEGRCEINSVCQYYRQIRDFFLKYGFIVIPYVLFIDGLPVEIKDCMGFFDDRVKNVLFVSGACFLDKYRNDPQYSALSVAFHEFLHAIANTSFEYDLLMASINHDELIKFVSRPNFLTKLLTMYTKEELFKTNEIMHRYIANNEDTQCLLIAIYRKDDNFIPPPEMHDLFYQLKDIFSKLEVTVHQHT